MVCIVSAIIALTMTYAKADQVSDMLLPSAKVSLVGKQGSGSATAFKVDPVIGTFLITNHHVASKGELVVQFYGDDTKYPAYVRSYDKEKDIAVIVTPHKVKHLVTFGYDSEVQIFDEAICVGASSGMPVAPSKGIISASRYKYRLQDYYRTDCGIIGGNSGGAIFVQRGDKWVYVGIPSMVWTISSGYSGRQQVTFLGITIRITEVREHLIANGMMDKTETKEEVSAP